MVNQRCFGFPQTNMPKNQRWGGEAAPHQHSDQKEGPSWPVPLLTVVTLARLTLYITLFLYATLFFLNSPVDRLRTRLLWTFVACLCISIGPVARREIPEALFTALLCADLTVSSAPTPTCHGDSWIFPSDSDLSAESQGHYQLGCVCIITSKQYICIHTQVWLSVRANLNSVLEKKRSFCFVSLSVFMIIFNYLGSSHNLSFFSLPVFIQTLKSTAHLRTFSTLS